MKDMDEARPTEPRQQKKKKRKKRLPWNGLAGDRAGCRASSVCAVCRFFEGLGFMVVAVSCPALVSAGIGDSAASRSVSGPATCPPAPAGDGQRSLGAARHRLARAVDLDDGRIAGAGTGAAVARARHYGPLQPMQLPGDLSFFAPVRQALARPLPWLLSLAFGMWATQASRSSSTPTGSPNSAHWPPRRSRCSPASC